MKRLSLFALLILMVVVLLTACGGRTTPAAPSEGGVTSPEATILVDGSSTVAPITMAIAEEFQAQYPNVRVPVGISGTGGGFKKFCAGETDISNASRPIRSSEIEVCQQNGIEYIELPVAYDGLAVVVNPGNDFVSCLTVEELKKAWEPDAEGKITNWNQVRADFPDRPLSLYGAGTDSGTYDYFTEAIVGKAGASRGDYLPSEDDNVLVQGVSGDENALGFFGLAYYEENKDKIKLVAVDGGNGCVLPSVEAVMNGTYQPLSRPLFIYVSRASIDKKPEIDLFIKFYLENAASLSAEVGYIPLPQEIYQLALERYNKRITGTVFGGETPVGVSLQDLLSKEK
ncbi:MAG: PstS family phosphate ABC transporter substrate-binding protein [Anaerolineales bacterium]